MKKCFVCFAVMLLILLFNIGFSYGDTLYVPNDYSTIQDAVDSAVDGDIVLVASGTYTSTGNRDINFYGKAITVQSMSGPETTIIDCENEYSHRGFYFTSGEGNDSVVQGFTIQNGYASDGGAIYCIAYSSPTITDCIIKDCYASSSGGGIYLGNASPVISNCVIKSNSAGDGAGIYCSTLTGATIINCIISENTGGGGISCHSSSATLITDCIIQNNENGGSGGGFSFFDCSPTVTNCEIIANTATGGAGGALYCNGASASPVFNNCLIANNIAVPAMSQGGAIYCVYGGPVFNNCTITGNTAGLRGGAIWCNDPEPVVENSIIWGNNPSTEQIYVWYYGDIDVSYSDIENSYPGTGNIDSDPLFEIGPMGDYYLSQIEAGEGSDSPCIDMGGDSAESLGLDSYMTRTDEVGDSGTVDMGYHYTTLYSDYLTKIEADYILSCQYMNPLDSAYGAINNIFGNPSWVVPRENAMAILGLIIASQVLGDESYLSRAQLAADYLVSIQDLTDGAWCDQYNYAVAADLAKSPTQTAEVMIALNKLGYDSLRYSAMSDGAQFLMDCQDVINIGGVDHGLVAGGKDDLGNYHSWRWASDNAYSYWAIKAAQKWATLEGDMVFAQGCAESAERIIDGINNYLDDPGTDVWYIAIDQDGVPLGNPDLQPPYDTLPGWINYAPQMLDVPVNGLNSTDVGDWISSSFQQGDGSCIGYEWENSELKTRKYPGFSYQASLCWFDTGQTNYIEDALSWTIDSDLWQLEEDGNNVIGGWIDWIEVLPTPDLTADWWLRFIDTSFYSICCWNDGYDFTVEPASSLILHYNFNEDYVDEIAGTVTDLSDYINTGDLGGTATVESGIEGDALFLDGSGYTVVPSSGILENVTDSVTVETWIYPTNLSVPGNQRIVQRASCTWGFYIKNNRINFYTDTRNDGGAWLKVKSGSLTENQWVHVAGVYDGSNILLYVNGVLVDSRPQAGQLNTSSNSLYIGSANSVPTQTYYGLIDGVRIYNEDLTESDIQADMEESIPELVLHYSFEGGVAEDESSCVNSGVVNGAVIDVGVSGDALYFDGTDCIQTADSGTLDITDTLTVGAWINPSDLSVPGNQRILQRASCTWGFYIKNNRVSFYTDTRNDSGAWLKVKSGPLTENQWVYVIGVYDGSNMYLYIDSVLVDTRPQTGQLNITIRDLFLGSANSVPIQTYYGLIDEVKIYNTVLLQDDIEDEYNAIMP